MNPYNPETEPASYRHYENRQAKNVASVEPEGEQTAEGIEPIEFYMRAQKRFIVSSKYYVQPEKWELKAMQEYAASQLAQYKAKLIAEIPKILEGIEESECQSDEAWWETGIGARFGRKKLAELLELIKNTNV